MRRPFLLVNMAMTADGKIATASRALSSFGSARDQAHLYDLRARADAIMCGARTLDSAEVQLDPGAPKYRRRRQQLGLAEFPLRVVVTGSGSINPKAAIFREHTSPLIVLTTRRAGARRLTKLRALADEVRICGRDLIHWLPTLAWLRQKWGVRQLLCEGGGELNDALFRAGVVDELHLTVCPLIFGGRTASTIADGEGFARLTQAAKLQPVACRRHGDELFLVFRNQHHLTTSQRHG